MSRLSGPALILGIALWGSSLCAEERKKAPLSGITVIFEFIEVKQAVFSDYIFETPLRADASSMRKTVQKWVKSGDGKIRETLIVSTRNGQRAKTEAVREVIYPTKYSFPSVPLVKLPKDGAGTAKPVDLTLPILPIVPPTPGAFQTRNAGTTLEVEAVLQADHEMIDLSLASEWVVLLDRSEWESKMDNRKQLVETPTFHTSAVTTSLTSKNGVYAFLGTSRMAKEQQSGEHFLKALP